MKTWLLIILLALRRQGGLPQRQRFYTIRKKELQYIYFLELVAHRTRQAPRLICHLPRLTTRLITYILSTKVLHYKKKGTSVHLFFRISGTSDSTSASINLPFTAINDATNNIHFINNIRAMDN